LLFHVHATDHDKWIQFTYRDGGGPIERLIDMIIVQKVENGTPLARPKIHFRQFWRNEEGRAPLLRDQHKGDPEVAGYSDDLHTGDNCYSCHPNGMRELAPAPGTLRPTIATVTGDALAGLTGMDLAVRRIEQFNGIMKSYGAVDWNGALDPTEHGPPMGRSISCANCHNNLIPGPSTPTGSRGAINASTARYGYKVSEDLSMPMISASIMKRVMNKRLRGIRLDASEEQYVRTVTDQRNDYVRTLNREYPDQVREWLKAADCTGRAPSGKASTPARKINYKLLPKKSAMMKKKKAP
jgi:hypothetical protein